MGRTWIALSICLLNMIADVVCMCITRSWMLDSGVIYISEYQLNLIWFSIISYGIVALLFEVIYVTGRSMHVYINMGVLFILIAIQSYSGVTWLIDPKSVFTSLSGKWEENINTPKTALIQKQLRCCGFLNAKEFKNDNCKESSSQACLPAIMKYHMTNVRIVGVFSIAHIVCNAILLLLLWWSIRRKRRHHRRKSKKNHSGKR